MTALEAHLAAEVVAAQMLDDTPDIEKLRFLRQRTAEVLAYLDEQLEYRVAQADRELVGIGGGRMIQRGVLVAMLDKQPVEFWATKWGVSRESIIQAVSGS